MATQSVTDAYGTYYYIDSASSRERLTWSQMQTNATYFHTYVAANHPTWTLNAMAAILGNVQSEGIMNPAQWEYGYGQSTAYGYGLVQWTPATKYLDWCTSTNKDRLAMGTAVDRFEWERANGEQYYPTSKYNITFTSFLTDSSHSVDTLARAWLYNYERPADPASTEGLRVSQANTWYEFLSGEEPDPPTPPDPPDPPIPPEPMTGTKRLKPCYYHKFKWD